MNVIRFAFLVAVVLLAGCARVSTSTTLNADGSFVRKVVYTVSKSNGLGPPSGADTQKKEKPEDYFKLPSGPGVKVDHSEDKNGLIVTTTRTVAAGSAPLQDIALIADKTKILATSSVTVTKFPDGRLEYVESLHKLEPSTTAQQFVIPDLRARVKKALPVEYQKTELIDRLTREIMINLAHALVGPPEPNLFNLLLTPDSSARRVNALAFTANVQSFKNAVPDMTPVQATTMARTLANVLNQDMLSGAGPSGPGASPNKENSADNDMTPLFFAVSFPGKMVETNGLLDPVTGEVYWSLLPMALDLGDVQLRLVVQP
ncbi:MAG: hypothetical protein ACHQ50_03580 [Fimbriimonadales bacterium]